MAFEWLESGAPSSFGSDGTISAAWNIDQYRLNVGSAVTWCDAVRVYITTIDDDDPQIRFAIYANRVVASTGGDYPGELLHGGAACDVTASGLMTYELDSPVQLASGVNWVCVRAPDGLLSPVTRVKKDSAGPGLSQRASTFANRQVSTFAEDWPDPSAVDDSAGTQEVYVGMRLDPNYIPFLGGGVGGGGGPPRPDELRYVGMDADNETLYVTSLQQPAGGGDNLWTLFRINLDTLIAAGSETFGSGAFGNIDLLNAGIYPVAKPGTDNVLFLRGRDGSDIKVQKADYNSASAWSDIGEASPTWGATDFVVSLQPDHFNASDMMAFFKSGSVYRTVTEGGSGSWTKQSNAPHGLRAAARHPNEPKRSIVAASGAGSMFYSHNLGASFAGASGSALGLVDAIEWDL